ncbi:hypothetical protein [Clostridium ihumii]|uniref:hypothetical protein n=1 Tax=Clostridium ihumii TaxID=1470356 RepID=UPI00058FE36E|nr:hypothetical protein [Clostridium ihumii]
MKNKSYKFYVKTIKKTPLFVITICIIFFLSIFQSFSLKFSINAYIDNISYALIASHLFTIMYISYLLLNKYEILEYIEINIFRKYLSILITTIKISILTCLIPTSIILTLKSKYMCSIFNLKGLFNLIILWILSNLFVAVLTIMLSILFDNKIIIFLSIGIYIPITGYSISNTKNNVFSKFINIFSDSVGVASNNISDIIINKFYILDKLFILVCIVFMLCIIYYKFNKNNKMLIVITIFFILFQGVILHSGNHSFKKVDMNLNKVDNVTYDVENYKMNLSLKNKLKNTCKIELNIKETDKEIKFLLDDSFKISSVQIGSKHALFLHEKDILYIKLPENIPNKIDITIKYEGNIFVLDEMNHNIFYTSYTSNNLPCKAFYWYPSIQDDEEVEFEVGVCSSSKLFSNLDIIKKSQKKYFYYLFKGKSKGVNIFSGNYKLIKKDNIEYILPKGYSDENFDLIFDSFVADIENNNQYFSIEDIEKIRNRKFKKLIVCIWNENMNVNLNYKFQIFEDTILFNDTF